MTANVTGRLFILLTVFLFASTLAARADKRVALVIGNAVYQHTQQLANPANDATDVAAALEKNDFKVILGNNLDKRGMERAIVAFARLAQDADAALFYYAGHGLQHQGINYLMPVDARLEDEFSLNFELTRVADIISALQGARGVKILVLDACRNNPLALHLMQAASTRALGAWRGLARIDSIHGMVIAYSAQPNHVALDGNERNSPFAKALLRYIDQPGLEIGALFRRVAAEVNDMTAGKQTPELSLSLFGDFYLNPRPSDMQAWSNIRDADSESQFKQFLRDYPQSILAQDARERLAAIARGRRDAELRAQQAAALEKAQREHEAQLKAVAEQERRERDKMIREIAEREKREREQLAKEVADIAKSRAEQAQQLRAQLERARLEREKLAKALAERDKRPDALSEQQRVEQNKAIQQSLAQEKGEREHLTQQLAALTQARDTQEQQLRAQTARAQAERDRLAKALADREKAEQTAEGARQGDAQQTEAIRTRIEQEKHERKQLAKELAELAKARKEQERQLREEVEEARKERDTLAKALAEQKSRQSALSVPQPGVAGAHATNDAAQTLALLTKPAQPLPPQSPSTPPPGDLARDLQKELQRVGCYFGAIDGNWGPKSRTALRTFYRRLRAAREAADPTAEALATVIARKGDVCPQTAKREEPANPSPVGRTASPSNLSALRERCGPGRDTSACRELCKLSGNQRACVTAQYRPACQNHDLDACQKICAVGGQGACRAVRRMTNGGFGLGGRRNGFRRFQN